MRFLDYDMGNVLMKSAALDFGIQWVGFAVAAALKTEKFYDLAGRFWFCPSRPVVCNTGVGLSVSVGWQPWSLDPDSLLGVSKMDTVCGTNFASAQFWKLGKGVQHM